MASHCLIALAYLQTVLLSLDLSASALQGLSHTSAALDVHEYRIEPYVAKRDAPEPVAPEIPKVLPHVHQLWAPLLAALKVSCLSSSCVRVYWSARLRSKSR